MNKEEAARFLGCSVRALERYTQQAKISARYERGRTKPVPVYEEAELAKFKAELDRRFAPRPALALEIPPNPSTGDNQAISAPNLPALELLKAALVEAYADAQKAVLDEMRAIAGPSNLAVKLLLSEREAASYSGLPLSRIRAERRALKTRKIGNSYKLKRETLEAFIKKV